MDAVHLKVGPLLPRFTKAVKKIFLTAVLIIFSASHIGTRNHDNAPYHCCGRSKTKLSGLLGDHRNSERLKKCRMRTANLMPVYLMSPPKQQPQSWTLSTQFPGVFQGSTMVFPTGDTFMLLIRNES